HTRMIYLLSVLPTRPPPTLTLFPYTTLFRSTQRSNKRTRAGYWNNPYPGLAALTHQAIARIADQWCTSVRYQCHIFAGLTFLNKDRKSTRLNSSHVKISYAVFCLKKKNKLHI